jgi:DNA adenine methylase
MTTDRQATSNSGRYSPLRYPGGKGKIVRYVKSIIRENGLSDGLYVEPYAGGAAIAWELLITGVVRRVSINDISLPIYAFWRSVLNETELLCRMIQDATLSVDEWDNQKKVYVNAESASSLELAFAFFFLNRTNRSGILNAGVIGGRNQNGNWKIDARFNKSALIARIQKIAEFANRIEVSNLDAIEFLGCLKGKLGKRSFVYIDPPYFEKGRFLYHDAYEKGDHEAVSVAIRDLGDVNWIVSYDDVRPIHDLYGDYSGLQYTLNYSARNVVRGNEVMFFSPGMNIPAVQNPLLEVKRFDGGRGIFHAELEL